MMFQRYLALWFSLFCLCVPFSAHADGFNVSPITLHLSQKQNIATLLVTNDNKKPVVLQIKPKLWTQANGKDVYQDTQDILVTPPIITVPPQSKQTIRVALMRPVSATKELAYRVYVSEVPIYGERYEKGKVTITLRFGIPLFIDSVEPATQAFTAQAKRTKNGQIKVQLNNTGNVHLKIIHVALVAAGESKPLFSQSAYDYILSGQSKDFLVAIPAGAHKHTRLIITTDQGNVTTDINIPER